MTTKAIQLAKECGRPVGSFTHETMNAFLETFYTRAQAQVLREAVRYAENMDGIFDKAYGAGMLEVAGYLRRMATELESKI